MNFHRLQKFYVSFSPIISLALIVLINAISLVSYQTYIENTYWINMFVGISVVQSMRDLAMVKLFNFCSVSRYSVYAILSFAPIYLLDYIIFGQETIANIIFQIVVGIFALIITFIAYIKKYPNCKMTIWLRAKKYSLEIWNTFLQSLAKNNFKCESAFKDFTIKRQHYHNGKTN
jgi:hypothetical protein